MASPRTSVETTPLRTSVMEQEVFSDDMTNENIQRYYYLDEPRGEEQASWGGWFKSKAKSSWHYVRNRAAYAAKFVKAHPIVTVAGPILAGTNTANATVAIPGIATKDLFNAEAWSKVPGGKIVLAVLSGLSSMIVNTRLTYGFALSLADKFKNLVHKFKTSWVSRITIFASMLFVIGAGFSAAIIGVDAWLFATLAAALVFGTFNAIHTMLSRLFGILNLESQIQNSREEHVIMQKKLADILRLINPKYKDALNAMIRNNVEIIFERENLNNLEPDTPEWNARVKNTFTDEQYRRLVILTIADLHVFYETHPDLFDEKSLTHYILEYGAIGIDLFASLFMFVAAYFPFSQRGYDGVRLVADLTSGIKLNDLTSPGTQAAIGALAGISSGLSYLESGWVVRRQSIYLGRSLRDKPANILAVLLALFMIGFSGLGNATIARGIVNNKDNYMGLQPHTWLSMLYQISFIIAGVIANARMMPSLTEATEGKNIDLEHLIYRFQEAPDKMVDEEQVQMHAMPQAAAKPAENANHDIEAQISPAADKEEDQLEQVLTDKLEEVAIDDQREREHDALLERVLDETGFILISNPPREIYPADKTATKMKSSVAGLFGLYSQDRAIKQRNHAAVQHRDRRPSMHGGED